MHHQDSHDGDSHRPDPHRPDPIRPAGSTAPAASGPPAASGSRGSALADLIGALTRPGDTFRRLRQDPRWGVALLLLVLASGALGWAVHQRTDYREMTVASLEARNQAGALDEGDLDRIVSFQERFGLALVGFQALVGGLVLVVIAAVFWVAFRLVGSDLSYRQSLATSVHGFLPGVLYATLATPVVLAGGELSYRQIVTRDLLASNLSFLAPGDAGVALRSLLTGLDFFSLWSAVLLAIGYRAVARVSTGLATAGVAVLWLAGLGLRVLMAWMSAGGGA